MPSTQYTPRDPRDSPVRRQHQRRRRTHHRTDSNGALIEHGTSRSRRRDESWYPSGRDPDESEEPSTPSKSRPKKSGRDRRQQQRSGSRRRPAESEFGASRTTTSATLSVGQLARLDQLNRKLGWSEYDGLGARGRGAVEEDELTRAEYDDDREREREERQLERERRHRERREEKRRRREEERQAAMAEDNRLGEDQLVYDVAPKYGRTGRRIASGQRLERGSEAYYSEKEEYREDVRRRDGGSSDLDYDQDQRQRKRRRNFIIAIALLIIILAIAVPVGVVVSKKDSSSSSDPASPTASQPSNSNLAGISESSIPAAYQGTSFDPFTWYDTTGFNVTFTPDLVGGLPIIGLNSTWDDNTQANPNVKPLNETWNYGTDLIHGVNLGGWLSIEPFITPSLFSSFDSHEGVVDEWTLSQTLGPSKAKTTIEQHYSSFVSEQTFANISAAGFDHVRIPYSYWAVITYDGDPYVPNISFRYLLRGIEWARKYGLRVNLDLHGAPGSQNGWNHSGRQGLIRWLNGTNGTLNGDRTVEIHKQVATFFSQPRYKQIITMYGLVNEPRMVELNDQTVIDWSETAITTIRAQNYTGVIIFGDGFMGLPNWQGKMQNIPNILLDAHQYVIFNTEQLVLNHTSKIDFACQGWTQQAVQSMNTATGFGPTVFGEWSQADTDCVTYLNNVGVGSRWEGTLNMANDPGGAPGGDQNASVLTPTCPTDNNPRCSCSQANADPSTWSAQYKQWLLMFAEAQMHSFEQGWGWFYWTWQTESAYQWSYQDALAAGVMPKLAYQRSFDCSQSVPDYATLGLPEYY